MEMTRRQAVRWTWLVALECLAAVTVGCGGGGGQTPGPDGGIADTAAPAPTPGSSITMKIERAGFLPTTTVEIDARGGLRRGQDDWNLRYLLPDRLTSAGERARSLDRHLLTGTVELRLVARPLPRIRATVGAHLEGLRSDQDVGQSIDAFQLGNRSRTRVGAFASARTRLLRSFIVDGRATFFRDTWATASGGQDQRWRFDIRLRATAPLGPLMVFALGSLTEDRHDLSGGEAQPGFANLDFEGCSWLALGGATATLGTFGWISATYSLVANTVDLTTRLQDAALVASGKLPWRGMRLQVSGRYLDFRDRAPAMLDGQSVLVLLTLAGSF